MNNGHGYPRHLTSREKAWLDWLLPSERKGYRDYRERLDQMLVIGEGRRGKGNFVLGRSDDNPDLTSPLPPVFAYGAIEGEEATISILTREEAGGQIEIEIVPLRGDVIPEMITERKRWTYSTWSPGNSCPCCSGSLREVRIGIPVPQAVLAICQTDHRVWVYDAVTEVNHLIPITNFYNELMLHKKIRNPETALRPDHLFSHLHDFRDDELVHAFLVYNKIRKKVQSDLIAPPPVAKGKRLSRFIQKILHHSE